MFPKSSWQDRAVQLGSNLLKTNRPYYKQIILTTLFCLATFILLSLALLHPIKIVAGKPSPVTVKASKVISFVNIESTKQLKDKEANEVQKTYQFDPTVYDTVAKKVDEFFGNISKAERIGINKVDFDKGFPKDIIDEALRLDGKRVEELKKEVITIARRLLNERLADDEIEAVKVFIPKQVALTGLSGSERTIASEVIKFYIRPNYTFDKKQTQKARELAVANIKPVIAKKIPGEIVVRDGEIVTKQQEDILNRLKIYKNKITPLKILGVLLLAIALVAMLTFYTAKYQKHVFESARLSLLFQIILLVNMAIAKLMYPSLSIYLIPIQATAMLTSVLLSESLAIAGVIFMALFTGMLTGNSSYIIYGSLSGLFAVFFTSRISSRQKIAATSTFSAIAAATISAALGLSWGKSLLLTASDSVWSLAGGGFSGILTIGLLGFLEPVFKVTTDMRLLELVNPNHPLLKDLMFKTPGTYNHSIIVGNMVEAAADEVGANHLLARAGAYYHDIGKTKRPQLFIENKYNQENGHDKLSPNLSCKIITAHVTEGLALAQKYRLPKEVCDIIQQHHGTSVVKFFYEKAKQRIVKESICEEDFRYPGNLPQSREAALVMLADAIEAATRTLSKPTINRVKQISKKIIDSKLKDGQLDESDLTLGDLRKITDSFATVLSSIYHTRIEYPESDLNLLTDEEVPVAQLFPKAVKLGESE